jgi:hypothetical protein
MDGREGEEEAENVGSEHESMNSECETQHGNCKYTKLR